MSVYRTIGPLVFSSHLYFFPRELQKNPYIDVMKTFEPLMTLSLCIKGSHYTFDQRCHTFDFTKTFLWVLPLRRSAKSASLFSHRQNASFLNAAHSAEVRDFLSFNAMK